MRFENLNSERGSAAIEFITIGVMLLVPLVYLVVVLNQLQAGMLAAEGAARQAAREWVLQPNLETADAIAARNVALAAADFGFPQAQVEWHRDCPDTCLRPGSRVTISVTIHVPLPGAPPALQIDQHSSIAMSAQASQTVSRFGGTG